MAAIPKITEAKIKTRVGDKSFQRGQQYYESDAIFNARRQGMTLKAQCEGSRAEAYRLHVTFKAGSISEADCSCPVGDGGHCKHIAALLLNWLKKPKEFVEVEELDKALERRSKQELVGLIKQMLRQQPELEMLLETPLPTSGQRRMPVSAEVYRRQAESVFRSTRYEWGAESVIADELSGIQAIGDEFLTKKDYPSAAAVYEGVSSTILNYYGEMNDEGDLAEVISDCVEGLGKCLAGIKEDAGLRETILRALFEVYRFDVDYGGIGISDEVPGFVKKHATEDERKLVAGWVGDQIPKARDWSRQAYGRFLLDLERRLSDEAYLKICRETGRVHDLVDRLLKLKRLDEAIKAANSISDYELLGIADLFVHYKHADAIESMMMARAQKTKDSRILEWLKKRFYTKGDKAAALELAENIFNRRPSFEGYQELKKLAEQLGKWDSMKKNIIAALKREKNLLIKIYLYEGEHDLAIEAAKAEPLYGFGYIMKLEVAKAVEKTKPAAALEIYQKHAEDLINQRGRDSYQNACSFLKKARDIYKKLGKVEEWQKYISKLREKNSSLRALIEEMKKAGL